MYSWRFPNYAMKMVVTCQYQRIAIDVTGLRRQRRSVIADHLEKGEDAIYWWLDLIETQKK